MPTGIYKRKRKRWPGLSQLCECNCGQSTKPGNRFISGHNRRGLTKENNSSVAIQAKKVRGRIPWNKIRWPHLGQLCECGCGRWTEPNCRFIHGHNRQGYDGWSNGLTKETSSGRASGAGKLRGRTKETHSYLAVMGKKVSEANSGKRGWSKDKNGDTDSRIGKRIKNLQSKDIKLKEEYKEEIIRLRMQGMLYNDIKKMVSLSIRQIREISKGQPCLCGCGIPVNSGARFINRHNKRNCIVSEETRRKQRLAAIKRVEKRITNGEQVHPSYNERACGFFEQFDRDLYTNGQYATNGGEFYVKELCYWLDYINFDLRLIIEWDEEFHYVDGSLRPRDVRRQKEIQGCFPDFKFVRLRENKLPETLLGFPMKYVDESTR